MGARGRHSHGRLRRTPLVIRALPRSDRGDCRELFTVKSDAIKEFWTDVAHGHVGAFKASLRISFHLLMYLGLLSLPFLLLIAPRVLARLTPRETEGRLAAGRGRDRGSYDAAGTSRLAHANGQEPVEQVSAWGS